ncbi:pyridoxal phosphate-dependent aminotransferase [Celerinatantimonas yamalensis]|uniref:Pyridoxal phosphate-dependent aminotransferase n=1 Tax=Celerinatantimonas yamalensis TaxID=559956 RepID=A0ABW9G5V9_9GAMM
MPLPSLNDINPVAASLEASSIRAIANFGMTQEGVIPLWFGESDIVTPEFICQAAFDSLAAGQTRYTPNNGILALRQALSSYQTTLFNQSFDEDNIVVTVSGTNAVMLAAQTIISPTDKVVVITPAFPTLMAIPRLLGAQVIEFPLTQMQGRFELDLNGLFKILKGARALVINSPANPTGWVASFAQLCAIAEFSRQMGIWVISDEVYNRHVYQGQCAPSFAQIMNEDDRIIICNSFSKAWCMTGWRLGWLTLPKVLRPTITKLIEFNVSCAPAFVQAAGLAAITQGEVFLQQTLVRFRQSRTMVYDALNDVDGITLYDMPATFYAFIKVDGLADDSQAYILNMIRNEKVGVAPGEAFGEAGKGHLRICYGQNHQSLALALQRLRRYLSCYHN